MFAERGAVVIVTGAGYGNACLAKQEVLQLIGILQSEPFAGAFDIGEKMERALGFDTRKSWELVQPLPQQVATCSLFLDHRVQRRAGTFQCGQTGVLGKLGCARVDIAGQQ